MGAAPAVLGLSTNISSWSPALKVAQHAADRPGSLTAQAANGSRMTPPRQGAARPHSGQGRACRLSRTNTRAEQHTACTRAATGAAQAARMPGCSGKPLYRCTSRACRMQRHEPRGLNRLAFPHSSFHGGSAPPQRRAQVGWRLNRLPRVRACITPAARPRSGA